MHVETGKILRRVNCTPFLANFVTEFFMSSCRKCQTLSFRRFDETFATDFSINRPSTWARHTCIILYISISNNINI